MWTSPETVLATMRDIGAALATLEASKRNYDGAYQKPHPNHGDLLVQRAQILQRAGRLKDARADCASGLGLMRRLEADEDFYKTNAAICAKI